MRRSICAAAVVVSLALPAAAGAQDALMSGSWAREACEAWNKNAILTEQLVQSEWIKNDRGRGFKVLHLARKDCGAAPTAELRIALKDGKALCVYGGKVENATRDSSADYLMRAETARWKEMGKGEYGPMRAMMFGRLEFEGPKLEAMGNMTPFEQFLLLVGQVPAVSDRCPTD